MAPGSRETFFTLQPVDNALLDGSRNVTFAVVVTGHGYVAGEVSEAVVDIRDNEVASTVVFPVEHLSLTEGAVASSIQLQFSAPAPAEGMLVFELASDARYGIDYHTVPAAVDGKLFVPVQLGASQVAVSLLPVNDAVRRADRDVALTVVYSSGGVCHGAATSLRATIVDDDNYQLHHIEEARALFGGSPVAINGEYYIEGVITTANNIMPGKFFVEDETAGVRIAITSLKSFSKGDLVLFNLRNGLLERKDGVLEITGVTEATHIGPGEVSPRTVSVDDLLADDGHLQGTYVQVTGLAFDGLTGASTMLGDHMATDGTRSIVVRTTGYASFRDEVVPQGTLSIAGILTSENGVFVLHPQVFAEDIIADQSSLRPWDPLVPVKKYPKNTRK